MAWTLMGVLHIALWEPEIPPNTGNIARLCAATDTGLHLIGSLGFHLDDRHLKRAGCDYWPQVKVHRHDVFEDLQRELAGSRIFPFSAHAKISYTSQTYRDGDCLLFGSESRGLPRELLASLAAAPMAIPMPTGKVRSLNLATAAGIVLYEALRQINSW